MSEAGELLGSGCVSRHKDLQRRDAPVDEAAREAGKQGAPPGVAYVDESEPERITDRHYRTFSLPCAPFEERLTQPKR